MEGINRRTFPVAGEQLIHIFLAYIENNKHGEPVVVNMSGRKKERNTTILMISNEDF